MVEDVTSQIGDLMAKAKTFGNSDNIRCGKYEFLIKRIFADKMESGRFAIAEFKTLKSEPNPQVVPTGVTVGTQFDDGMKPNAVGSDCALKINFDGNGAKSAPGNLRAFVLGLFGKTEGEVTEGEANETWKDISRSKDLKQGELIGVANGQPVYAKEAKAANPCAGWIIRCIAKMKEKKKTRDVKDLDPSKREYVTVFTWECVAAPGTGLNSKDEVMKRRAELLAASTDDDDDDEVQTPAQAAMAASQQQQQAVPTPTPPSPMPAQAAPFAPAAPWELHSDPKYQGPGPENRWFWSNPSKGGDNSLKSEAQFRAGQ